MRDSNTEMLYHFNISQTMDFSEDLSQEIIREKRIRKECIKEMRRLDEYKYFRLSCYKKNGELYYSMIRREDNSLGKKKRWYMGKRDENNAKTIENIIYYRYLYEYIKRLDCSISRIENLLEVIKLLNPQSISANWGQSYFPLPEECYQISGSLNINKWREEHLSVHRINNPKYPQDLRHQADHNLKVRSKSEVIICNQLIQNGLAFVYEPDLKLGNYTVSPDFLVLSEKKKRLFVWEHMGLLDDSKYMKNALWKLQHYQDEGIILGQNLIVTYDDTESGINSAEIGETIRKYFIQEKHQEEAVKDMNMQ